MRRISVFTSCLAITAAMTISWEASAADLVKITLAVSSPSFPAAGPRIAKEMGLFEKHGLDARVTAMDNGSVATMGLISGSVDFASTAPTDVIVSQSRGQDVVAITSVYGGFGAVVVISKAAAKRIGVSPSDPISARLKALDGLVIASPSATSTYTFALKAANAVGARPRLTYMAIPTMPTALTTGAIQGFIGSSPFYAQPILSGSGVMWINGPKGEFPQGFAPVNAVTINTRRDYATAHPDIVQRVMDVFVDFGHAVVERPNEVKAAILRVFPDLDAKTLDLIYATEGDGFNPRPLTAADMANEIAFVKASGVPLPNVERLDPKAMMFP